MQPKDGHFYTKDEETLWSSFCFLFSSFFQFDFGVDVVGVVNVDIAVAVVAVVIVVFDLTLMAGPDLTFFLFQLVSNYLPRLSNL